MPCSRLQLSSLWAQLIAVVMEGIDDRGESAFAQALSSESDASVFPFPSVSLPHHRDIIRNCAVSVDQIQDLHSPMSPISENPTSPAYSTGRHHPAGHSGTRLRLSPAQSWAWGGGQSWL